MAYTGSTGRPGKNGTTWQLAHTHTHSLTNTHMQSSSEYSVELVAPGVTFVLWGAVPHYCLPCILRYELWHQGSQTDAIYRGVKDNT